MITYNSPNKLTVGPGIPVRVNLNVGAEKTQHLEIEHQKIKTILNAAQPPDLIMDLSIVSTEPEPWRLARDRFDGPIGVLPHYIEFSESHGLNPSDLLKRIKILFEDGINFITIHCTPTTDLFALAKNARFTPVTSRGGGVVIRDMLMNKRAVSIFSLLFEEICALAKEFKATINLGTAFRSASVAEGFDAVVREELRLQRNFCQIAKHAGVQIVLEGPGHIPMSELKGYWNLIKSLKVPPMPLGPIITDSFTGLDHIASAIGAAHFMMLSKGGIINTITTIEHKGGVPNIKHLLEGLRAAKLAAQAASLTYNKQAFDSEIVIARKHGDLETCVLESTKPGCTRCGHLCPLVSDAYPLNAT